ncbi:MAG: hypothetical protein IJ943_01315 [Akkermansia sp.]|nr:hypothetical protein [Akkermansia sp.]
MMKNTLIAALIVSLPVLAQDAPQPEGTPIAPQSRHWGAGGMMPRRNMSAEDCAAMRENIRRRMLERFDTDKDGQLSDEERAAARAQMGSRRPHGERAHRPQGPAGNAHPGNRRRPHGERQELIQSFDTDGNGQLSEAEREALRTAIQNRRAERAQRGPHRPRPEGHRPMPQAPAADIPTTLEL